MATPTIIATVGASNANSFGTRAEADSYFDTVLHSSVAWPVNVSATTTIGSGTNGVVTTIVDTLGTEGNSYTISVVAGVGLNIALSAVLVGTAITVTLGTDGTGALDSTKNTAILVASAISALTGITASASGTGATIIPVTALTAFTGGSYVEETKNPALIMAQQQMTALIIWTGFITNTSQKLPWPRTGMWQRDELVYIDEDTIPDEVKWVQFELARLLIAKDRTEEFDIDANGITHLRAGPVTMKFKEGFNPGPSIIPASIYNLLVPSWYTNIIGLLSANVNLERA